MDTSLRHYARSLIRSIPGSLERAHLIRFVVELALLTLGFIGVGLSRVEQFPQASTVLVGAAGFAGFVFLFCYQVWIQDQAERGRLEQQLTARGTKRDDIDEAVALVDGEPGAWEWIAGNLSSMAQGQIHADKVPAVLLAAGLVEAQAQNYDYLDYPSGERLPRMAHFARLSAKGSAALTRHTQESKLSPTAG